VKNFGIQKNVLLLGFVSCLNDISSEMIIPILPLIIKSVGGSGIAIGLISGLRESFANVLKFVFGYLSDHWGIRKPFIYWGYITALCFRFSLLFAKSWQVILALIGFERFGKGMRTTPRDALISFSSEDQLGTGFGVHRALDTFGAILGSLFVVILLGYYAMSLTGILIISTGIGLISLIPLIWVHDIEQKKGETLPSMKSINFSLGYIIFTVTAGLFSLANVSYMFFMIHAQAVLNHNGTFLTPIILYVFFNIFYALSAIPLGVLIDRLDRRSVLVAGYVLFGVTLLGFATAKTVPAFALCFILYGIALAITKVGHSVMASSLSRDDNRATALGFIDTVVGIMALVGGGITGLLWEYINHTTIFFIAAIVIFMSAVMLLLCKNIFVCEKIGITLNSFEK